MKIAGMKLGKQENFEVILIRAVFVDEIDG